MSYKVAKLRKTKTIELSIREGIAIEYEYWFLQFIPEMCLPVLFFLIYVSSILFNNIDEKH